MEANAAIPAPARPVARPPAPAGRSDHRDRRPALGLQRVHLLSQRPDGGDRAAQLAPHRGAHAAPPHSASSSSDSAPAPTPARPSRGPRPLANKGATPLAPPHPPSRQPPLRQAATREQ